MDNDTGGALPADLSAADDPAATDTSDDGPDTLDLVYPGAYVVNDVPYSNAMGDKLLADVYVPAGPGPFDAVILVHGGGFEGGNRQQLAAWGKALQAEGIVGVSVDYRLVCVSENCPAIHDDDFPASLRDVKCATRWLRHNADTYSVNPDRIGVLGSSAGGWFASMMALTGDVPALAAGGCLDRVSDEVLYGVDFYGPTDFRTMVKDRTDDAFAGDDGLTKGESAMVGNHCRDHRAPRCKSASPVAWITDDDSPVFVTHSEDDPLVPVAQSREFARLLRQRGVAVEEEITTGLGHGWAERFDEKSVAEMRDRVIAWIEAQ